MPFPDFYRVSDNVFGKARWRFSSKAYWLVRRRGNRPITQSKIFIWKTIAEYGLTSYILIDNQNSYRHVAQGESTTLTRQGSRVQIPSCLPVRSRDCGICHNPFFTFGSLFFTCIFLCYWLQTQDFLDMVNLAEDGLLQIRYLLILEIVKQLSEKWLSRKTMVINPVPSWRDYDR